MVALVEALKMCEWLRNVLTELAVAELASITVYEDNQSSIVLVETLNSLNNNSRNFISRVSYLHDLAKAGILKMIYLASELMTSPNMELNSYNMWFQ